MTVLSYQTLKRAKPIKDMQERTTHSGMTYGLGPCGYDIRIAQDITIHPDGIVELASAMEEFDMPNNLMGVVHDKSSWARKGLAVQNTVIEPGWRGFLTLELTNHSTVAISVRAGDPIAQVIFHMLDWHTQQPYNGKYQDQSAGPQPAIEEQSDG